MMAMTVGAHLTRRGLAKAGLAAAAILAAPRIARAKTTEVDFVEAVHNLGYIDLYVGQHAGYFEQQGIHLNVTAAGGDTQAFAAVLGHSAMFGIGDPTMVPISVESGGPGKVVGTVVQRAHYFGVSKRVGITDPKQFKGLTLVTSPDPNTNYSVTKKLLTENGLVIGKDVKIIRSIPAPRSPRCWRAVPMWRSPINPASPRQRIKGRRSSSTLPRTSGHSAIPALWC